MKSFKSQPPKIESRTSSFDICDTRCKSQLLLCCEIYQAVQRSLVVHQIHIRMFWHTLCLVAWLLTFSMNLASIYHDYCIVGAGPSGLQLGYFLKTAARDYIIFERNNISGSFFQQYPRHRKLISLNKRHTGEENKEFSLRHDWNSLLSHDADLLVTKYSKEIFPHADVLVKYLNDFQYKLNINVQYNTNIQNIKTLVNRTSPDGHVFTMDDQTGKMYICRNLIMATGLSTPNIPDIEGMEWVTGYESMSLNPEDYEGKSVLILGRGNSAFEIADSLYGSTNLIHLVGRSRVRLAWSTHYVGDLRAVNNALLDTYQLKSLDGIADVKLENCVIQKIGKQFTIYIKSNPGELVIDTRIPRASYDIIIRALGFKFDTSPFQRKLWKEWPAPSIIFSAAAGDDILGVQCRYNSEYEQNPHENCPNSKYFRNNSLSQGKGLVKKFPVIDHDYESKDYKGLFYAGTASHSLDFRKSSGGFIHGFRYTAQALHRLLEWRYESLQWPSSSFHINQLLNVIVKRINEASGPYQMFQMLGDVVIFSEDKEKFKLLEDFPIHLLHNLPHHTGHSGSAYLVTVLEYGQNFSGPGNDVFRENRATQDPALGHTSNFLHPVLYFYHSLPTEEMMRSASAGETLPRPNSIHHIVEDFFTKWTDPETHILPLRRFLDHILNTDLRTFFSKSCFLQTMTYDSISQHCQQGYLHGQGLYGTKQLRYSS